MSNEKTTAIPLKLDARAYPIKEPQGTTIAFASITINDTFAVHSLKVVNGEKGVFVAEPSVKDKDGEFRKVAFPITAEARKQMSAVVLDAYIKAAEKSHSIYIVQSSVIKLLQVLRKPTQLFRVPDTFIEELLRRYTQVLTDEKEALHGGQRFLVFYLVDVVPVLPQRQAHITGRHTFQCPQFNHTLGKKVLVHSVHPLLQYSTLQILTICMSGSGVTLERQGTILYTDTNAIPNVS